MGGLELGGTHGEQGHSGGWSTHGWQTEVGVGASGVGGRHKGLGQPWGAEVEGAVT